MYHKIVNRFFMRVNFEDMLQVIYILFTHLKTQTNSAWIRLLSPIIRYVSENAKKENDHKRSLAKELCERGNLSHYLGKGLCAV